MIFTQMSKSLYSLSDVATKLNKLQRRLTRVPGLLLLEQASALV